MNAKQALDILIAVGICSTNNISLTCSDCPIAPEECDLIHSSEVIEEAIRLLKAVKVIEPNPADPEVFVPIRKPIKAPEGPPKLKLPDIEDILSIDVNRLNIPVIMPASLSDSTPIAAPMLHIPKKIAEIKLCGSVSFIITDTATEFIKPTPEQIKNLKEMLCIDVELLEEEQ